MICARRWLAYTAASAATAASGAATAEANIIYSGPINRYFSGDSAAGFPLQGAGNGLIASHHTPPEISYGAFFAVGSVTPPFHGAAVVGRYVYGGFRYNYASKLAFGEIINTRAFVSDYGVLASDGAYFPNAQWQQPGTGFVGFRFTGLAGLQYGWARINFADSSQHNFTLIDYAFADPGERIRAGQTSSATVPESGGSLGLLALGCTGLLAWRGVPRGATARWRRSG